MKVNISYLIELDEIPGKVREFLLKASDDTTPIGDGLRYAISLMDDNSSIEEQLKNIDKVRRKLTDIDHALLDCSEILHGYQKALVRLREPERTAPNSTPATTLPPEGYSFEEYSQQLKALHESLNHIQGEQHDDKTRNEETEKG